MQIGTITKFMDNPTLPDQLRMDKEASALAQMTSDLADQSFFLVWSSFYEVGCAVAHYKVWEMWKGSLQTEKTNTAEPQTDFEG